MPIPHHYDVFISYRRSHPTDARLVKQMLKERGFRVFLDVDDLGQCFFDERLVSVIHQTSNFICLVTPGSLDRVGDPEDWMRKEIETAFKTHRNVVTVVTDLKFDWNQFELPASLERLPAVNAVAFNHAYFGAFVDELVSRLTKTSEKEAAEEFARLDKLALSPAFRKWQTDTLMSWYKELLPDNTAAGAMDLFPSIAGETYAILISRFAAASEPFLHRKLGPPSLVEREVRELPALATGTLIPDWVNAGPSGNDRLHYFELLALTRRVRRWNMRGFALSALELNADREVAKIEAQLCTYGENCLTSHLLGYQMLRAYEDGNLSGAMAADRPHLYWDSVAEAPGSPALRLKSTEDFCPLISVQALVVYRDPSEEDEWHLVAMVRQDNVAAAAGFWQFPPAGGFEIYGKEDEQHDHVLSQFDIRLAIIREFLEEVFGDVDMACEHAEDASGDHTGSPGFQQVMSSLKNKLLSIHLMGVVTELVGLRSEFSFVIVMEDPKLLEMSYTVTLENGSTRQAKWLRGSHEGKRLMRFPIADLGRLVAGKTWNPSSIGMLKLLADMAADQTGWFMKKYPDFPAFSL